jgi:perosamine synthetase
MSCGAAETMSAATIELFHPVVLPEMELAMLDVLRSGQIASGPKVAEFERAFSSLVRRDHVVATSDMTSAVTLALHLAGVRAGDEVATLAFSCLSSNAPIALLGARAVWIDIEPATLSMSLSDLERKLTPKVKAVMVYHVAGYPADMESISTLCRNRGVVLIEDCNNAIGAMTADQPVGTHGDYSVFSLYPNRQVNAIEGGVLVTPDSATAARAKSMRRFGIDTATFRDARGEINPQSDVSEIGWSASLSNVNAAVALAQLSNLSERLHITNTNAANLARATLGLNGLKPVNPTPGNSPSYWGFGILADQRDALLAHLKGKGIKASVLHQRNDSYSGFRTGLATLPGTEKVLKHFMALPCGWWLSAPQVQNIVMELGLFSPP